MLQIHTWNTWDVRCLNAVMKTPEMAEVRVIVYDSQKHIFQEELRWESLVRLGPHSINGDYSQVTLRYREAVFSLEFAAEGDTFVYKISPVEPAPYLRFFIAGLFRWNQPGRVEWAGQAMSLAAGGQVYRVSALGKFDPQLVNADRQGILMDGWNPIYIACNLELDIARLDALLEKKHTEWESQALQGLGALEDAPQAMIRGILWNTIYEPIRQRICTPVTREWCIVKPERPWFGSYVLFVWDTCFNALIAGAQDSGMAYQQLYSLLQGMVNGMLPMLDSEINVYSDRSQPPLGSFVALKLYHQFGDLAFLDEVFDRLLSWHRWWLLNRDGNGDGLLEWGTNLPVTHDDLRGYLNVAACESMDNSPMYDETVFNPHTHTMELADVGLNSFYALDTWALSEIATLLGQANTAGELRQEYEEFKQRLQTGLWNEELGIYCNRHWDGRFSRSLSPTSFYPMLAGVATPDQCRRMVTEHLLNPAEFWGKYALPSISRDHPAFGDNDYWRGRIWAPINYLVYEGLKRAGYAEIASQLAEKSLNLFLQEWQSESHIHENYNALTGEGDDVPNADPVYTWGGLLGYLATNEVISASLDGGLCFGNLAGAHLGVRNFPAQGSRFDVEVGPGLVVYRDGVLLFSSNIPVFISRYQCQSQELSFHVTYNNSGKLRLVIPPGVCKVVVSLGDRQESFTDGGREVFITL